MRAFKFISHVLLFLFGYGEGAEGQLRTKLADPMDAKRSQEYCYEIRGCELFYNERHVVPVSI